MLTVADCTLRLDPAQADFAALTAWVHPRVFRHDFTPPGVALLNLGLGLDSRGLRRFMIALKEALSERHREQTGKRLVYLSMGRFDQQVTTKYHLDGAPEEAYLMLGYEPSEVESELYIADYSRAACEMGIDPRRFLDEFNPMQPHNAERLRPYMRQLVHFEPRANQIVLLNNSSYANCPDGQHVMGVMHKATIVTPDARLTRTVNSTMIGVANAQATEVVTKEMQEQFALTDVVAGRYGS